MLIVAALGLAGLPPGQLGVHIYNASSGFIDQRGYRAAVLGGPPRPPTPPPGEDVTISVSDLATAMASVLLAPARPVPGQVAVPWLPGAARSSRVAAPLRAVRSGIVNDYIVWMILGLACFGGALALTIR